MWGSRIPRYPYAMGPSCRAFESSVSCSQPSKSVIAWGGGGMALRKTRDNGLRALIVSHHDNFDVRIVCL